MTRDEWRQVEPVLTQALLLPDNDRDTLLDTVRLEEAIRRDLRELLRRSVAAPAPGVGTATLPSAEVVQVPRFVPPALSSGATLANGRYIVIRQIGRGGMGAVFLAHHTVLGKLVALKLMPHDDQVLAEGRKAAICSDHPHVATLHDVLTEQIGEQTFGMLVMEYVAGTPASRLLDDGPIEIPKVVKWGRQVAAAVAHAHEHQILHCDLKPANIVVGPDGNAKVLDFGISRTTFDTADADQPLRGTLPYMAPEQLRAQEFSPAGDIYSLGVTLFELATGRRPFDDEGGLLRMRILAAPPPAASDFVPAIPLELQRVLEQALEKEPEKRFRSARAFERALEAVGPVLNPGGVIPPTIVRVSLWTRVAVSALALAAAVAALVILGAYTSAAYNLTLGRAGFANESVFDWFNWGFRASTGPFAMLVISVLLWSVARVLWRLSMRLADPEGRRRTRFGVRARGLIASTGLDEVTVRAAAALIASMLMLAFAVFSYRDLIPSFVALAATSPPELLARLSPDFFAEHNAYRRLFSLSVLVIIAAWYPVLSTPERRRSVPRGLLVTGGLSLLIALILLHHPHRMLFSETAGYGAERVRWQERDCHVLGQRGSDTLLLCPEFRPPAEGRHRIVRTGDPGIESQGVRESVFRGFYRLAEGDRQRISAR